MKRKIKKGLKITGISLLSLIALLFLLPILFPDKVANQIKKWANQSIEGELNFSKSRLSFFKHFPTLTLSLYDYSLKGSEPFKKDTLLAGKELSFGINLLSIFKESIVIDRFYVDNSLINIQVDAEGEANYNIYKQDSTAAPSTSNDTSSARLKIDGIFITNSHLVYNDRSVPMYLKADGLNYEGRGDLAHEIFDLESTLEVDSVDFSYDDVYYVRRKHLLADLITGINTSSLAFKFQKNDVNINQLPVDFAGNMVFLPDGYSIDLHLISGVTVFGKIFSVLPPEYNQWLANTSFGGTSQLKLSLTGEYNARTNRQPDLNMHWWVKDGSINYKNSSSPLEHFYMAADFNMPNLNYDSATLAVDSLKFLLNGEATRASLHTLGLDKPYVKALVDSKIDLGLLDRTVGLESMELKGNLNVQAKIDGRYDSDKQLFPPANASVQFTNGTIRTPYYPNPIENIQLNSKINATSGTFDDVVIQLEPVSFVFEKNPFALNAKFVNLNNVHYDVTAKGILDLTKIYKVFAIDGYSVTGILKADLDLHGNQADAAAGRYQSLQNNGTLDVTDLKLYSSDYPYPFEVPQGSLKVQREKAWLSNTLFRYRDNEFKLTGYASNFIGYYLQGSELTGNFKVSSPKILLDQFMELVPSDSSATAATADTVVTTGVVMIPKNLNLALDADAKEVLYNGTTIKNFDGSLQMKQGSLLLPKTKFDVAGAHAAMSGSYAPTHRKSAQFTANFKADSFDVKKAYKEIPLFREMASSAGDAEGLISLDYALSGRLNEEMSPVYPSIKGKGVVTLENVKVKGMKLFGAVSKASGKDSLNNPNLKAVVIKSSIANNIITIERTKMKIFGFRPRFEGQTSLDGKLNLKIRVGLPPFGIIGIPMAVTGTSDKPIVKMRRGKDGEILHETMDEEEEEPEQ
ncbi:MAG TPA: AsmA-like C-terminal region-containing protein [Phnomibacter sp.]|nr:AsmA-like C-terminal region-containing protein [Phnomibacter sp.]